MLNRKIKQGPEGDVIGTVCVCVCVLRCCCSFRQCVLLTVSNTLRKWHISELLKELWSQVWCIFLGAITVERGTSLTKAEIGTMRSEWWQRENLGELGGTRGSEAAAGSCRVQCTVKTGLHLGMQP